VANRQRYCSRPACAKFSKAASLKKWRSQGDNKKTYSGLPDLVRMQEWRQAHPGYSRRRSRIGKGRGEDSFHEFARNFASRDEIDTQFYLVVGLISHLTEVASRDEIASEIRRLTLLGHGILHQNSGASTLPPPTD
jgi:hypothetical protein